MIKKLFFWILTCFIFLPNIGKSIESSWEGINEVKTRLVSPLSNTNSSSEIIVGLEYRLEENWKTYWKSPGAGGFPQELNFSDSTNIKAVEIFWPTPKAFSILGLRSLGYDKSVVFPLKIEIIDKLKPVELRLKIHFLVCNDICIPVDANLKLFIPSGEIAELTEHANKVEKYISLSPSKSIEDSNFEVTKKDFFINDYNSLLELEIKKKHSFNDPKIYIDNDIGLPVIEATLRFNETKNLLNAKFDYGDTLVSFDDKNITVHISDFPLVYEEQVNLTILENSNEKLKNNNFINIIIIAILGGLILNAMPCVLPVLSIKLLSAINYSGQKKSIIKKGFISTGIGIVVSYALLALALITIKYFGKGIGWGIQFQQPLFLMFISIVLLFFSFNLLDLYKINLPQFANRLANYSKLNKSFFSDFFSGFLATLMATPCSAPFVGTAITFAFTQKPIFLMMIFIFMGLGMALPYFVIATFPLSINLLPRPGVWMIWLRRLMAALLMLTIAWIGTILIKHFNYQFIYISLFLGMLTFLLLAFKQKFIFTQKYSFIIISLIAILYFSLPSLGNFESFSKLKNDKWIDINDANIEELIKSKKIIFVDITADWCVTCKYNKQNVINTKEIQELFKKYEVVQIQGDWTLPDKNIESFLNSYSRFGIPFNILYSYKVSNGIIFSELLTKKDIKDALINVIK